MHAGGQRFESVILHIRKENNDKAGSECSNTVENAIKKVADQESVLHSEKTQSRKLRF